MGGIPLTLEGKSSSSLNQRWEFIYPSGDQSMSSPFHIRSVRSGMYLVIDEALRMVLMQKDEPDQLWMLQNATGKAMEAMRRFSRTLFVDLQGQEELTEEPSDSEGGRIMKLDTFLADCGGSLQGDLPLQLYHGDLAAAFQETGSPGSQEPTGDFTLVSQILCSGVRLCDETRVDAASHPLDITDILPALYGPSSHFMSIYQKRRGGQELQWAPPQIDKKSPWLATGSLSCTVPVPVLGEKPYAEQQRFALCLWDPFENDSSHREDNQSRSEVQTLAIQQVGRIQAGRFGEFRSESLYLFTQVRSPGQLPSPIRLRAIALEPTGVFAGRALDGYKQALNDFLAAALPCFASYVPRRSQLAPVPGPEEQGDTSFEHPRPAVGWLSVRTFGSSFGSSFGESAAAVCGCNTGIHSQCQVM